MGIAKFEREPPLGTTLRLDDQLYELVSTEPYTRKMDGVKTVLLEWETACPEGGCGVSFRCKTGLDVRYLPRRCEECRKTRSFKPVKGKRGRRVGVSLDVA